MHSYEIEIKVLLGTEESKNTFFQIVQKKFPNLSHQYFESQLNHYFSGDKLIGLIENFRSRVDEYQLHKLIDLAERAGSFSVRTRGTQEQTILVVKATVNDESSSNGTARIEWETDFFPMSLEDLDTLVLSSGFVYQAKWSRERNAYALDDHTVLCIDKNAGYGYLAEFERVIDDPDQVEFTRHELLSMIASLGYHELDQNKLARMFDFYNKNWSEYYGTDRVFSVE